MAGMGPAVGDSPWIISKNYDAWGPPGAASRKRGGQPPPLAARARQLPRPGPGLTRTARTNKKADNTSVVDALMPLMLLMQIGISMPVQKRRDGAYI